MLRIVFAASTLVLALLVLAPSDSASAHNWYADDGCGPGTSPSGYFWAFGDSWSTDTSSGYGGCYMMTPNTQTGAYDGLCGACEWAEWYLPLSDSNYNHNYDIYTNIDTWICVLPALVGEGHYHRWRLGHTGGITAHETWDQSENCDGGWQFLHTGGICGTNGGLWDQVGWTGDPTNSYFVFTDVMLFNPHSSGHSC